MRLNPTVKTVSYYHKSAKVSALNTYFFVGALLTLDFFLYSAKKRFMVYLPVSAGTKLFVQLQPAKSSYNIKKWTNT
jgi:hypothetical protein